MYVIELSGLLMQWMPDEHALDPILRMFFESQFLIWLTFGRIAGVGHVLWSNTISTCVVPNVVKESLVAPTRWECESSDVAGKLS